MNNEYSTGATAVIFCALGIMELSGQQLCLKREFIVKFKRAVTLKNIAKSAFIL